jgi:hypothetical protein
VRVPAPESRTESSSDSRIGKSPKFGPSTVEIPGFRVFMTPPLHRIKVPELCTSPSSRLRRSQTSWIREFPAPEKHTLRMPLDFDVSRVMCFPEFPNNKVPQASFRSDPSEDQPWAWTIACRPPPLGCYCGACAPSSFSSSGGYPKLRHAPPRASSC